MARSGDGTPDDDVAAGGGQGPPPAPGVAQRRARLPRPTLRRAGTQARGDPGPDGDGPDDRDPDADRHRDDGPGRSAHPGDPAGGDPPGPRTDRTRGDDQRSHGLHRRSRDDRRSGSRRGPSAGNRSGPALDRRHRWGDRASGPPTDALRADGLQPRCAPSAHVLSTRSGHRDHGGSHGSGRPRRCSPPVYGTGHRCIATGVREPDGRVRARSSTGLWVRRPGGSGRVHGHEKKGAPHRDPHHPQPRTPPSPAHPTGTKKGWGSPTGDPHHHQKMNLGGDLLSHTPTGCSTISAKSLNYRVRKGTGCTPLAITTEKNTGQPPSRHPPPTPPTRETPPRVTGSWSAPHTGCYPKTIQ
ncbi:Uncharacterised protein [Mycobacteroides abscessus subsp. abscessus]|nr:Uncharacterised protein [Mycobacteroides abscessus subsp. abscessus]